MLFKRGLTHGLHCAVLEKTTSHPTTLHGWIEATCRQYKLWVQIKASLRGSFGKPPEVTPIESQKWWSMLGGGGSGGGGGGGGGGGKKHP